MTKETTTRVLLYLEDLQPGQVLRSSGESAPVNAAAIKAFARQYDPQPFHLDEAAAAKSFFRELVASGWHTAAVTMTLMVEGLPLAGGVIGAGLDEMRWPRPVRPGDRLRVEAEVLDVRSLRSRPEQGLAKVRITTLNQNGEPVQVMTANMVVQRRKS